MSMELNVAAKARQKRFRRSVEPAGMQLTGRDLGLLAHIARHRFLSTEHLAKLDGGSRRNLQRCLRALYDHRYLDRPRAQLAHVPADGPKPMVYGLGQRGARALSENGHRIVEGRDWTERNKRAGSIFIEHTLAIADFMVNLEVACRGRGNVRLVTEQEIIAQAPERTRKAREPLRWVSPASKGETSSVIPDGLFALAFADDTASYFALEIDRGTMPVTRRGRERSSYIQKLRTYWDGWKAGRHVEQFGVRQIRVVTVTTSAMRVKNMIAAAREVTGGSGSGLFVFFDRSQLAASDPLVTLGTSSKGEPVSLLD